MAQQALFEEEFWQHLLTFEEAKEQLFSGEFKDVIELDAANDNFNLFNRPLTIEEKVKALFRMRRNLEDHLNLDIVADALVAFRNQEWEPYGMPNRLFDMLSVGERIGHYAGSIPLHQNESNVKGQRAPDFLGLPYWKLAAELVGSAYVPGGDYRALNALIGLGKSGMDIAEREGSIRKNVQAGFTEQDVAQYYRTLHIPRAIRRNFPPRGHYDRGSVIPVDEATLKKMDSNYIRNMLTDKFLQEMYKRGQQDTPQVDKHFRAWLVASETDPGNFYFVQENWMFNKALAHEGNLGYNCSCPHVLFNIIRTAKDYCKHIKAVKALDS